jgi:hypothetical protein
MKSTFGFALSGFAGILVSCAVVAAGCGSNSATPTVRCVHNSECSAGLVCALGFCVRECVTSADCLHGARCVVSGGGEADGATDKVTTCLAPEVKSCQYNSQCASPLKCGVDLQCRDQCQTADDCASGQVCTSMSHLCVDPTLDMSVYDPATNELRPADGGAAITDGAADASLDGTAGADGAAGAGDGSAGRDGGADADAAMAPSCANPQTTFGGVAQGDTDPHFTSSVGARGADALYAFSAYQGPPPPDGGVDASGGNAVNVVYLQSFDPTTGDSRGPAAPLVHVTDNPYFFVQDAAVAPTGEIALLHSSGTLANGAQSQLYASFFKPAAGAGAPLALVKTVQLENALFTNSPQVIWSVADSAFVVAWKYQNGDWYDRVRKLRVDGRSAGGDTNIVERPAQLYSTDDDCRVGTSGPYVAVAYKDNPTTEPWMTILDGDGQTLGAPLHLSTLANTSWAAVGGTSQGFVAVFDSGSALQGVFVPVATNGAVDGGAPSGDGGAPAFATFSMPTQSKQAPRMVSDDMGGRGGVAMLVAEPNGASFTYVTADGGKRLAAGTILTSSANSQISITNYRGSFGLAVYDGDKHSTQLVASGCQD